jgi:hypothetical protein
MVRAVIEGLLKMYTMVGREREKREKPGFLGL